MEANNYHTRRTLSVTVDNEPGVLARVATLISGRGFNIDSLSVAETLDPKVSLITLVTTGSASIVEQIIKQLRKLINVIKVVDLTETSFVERQMALIKVRAEAATRAEVLRLVDIFRCKIVDVSMRNYIIEVTGGEDKIKALLDLLSNFGLEEIVCTGRIAMARSRK
ncbi:MAG: acetolactate synthase small subunit [Thermodesulfobacteriota bacterium]